MLITRVSTGGTHHDDDGHTQASVCWADMYTAAVLVQSKLSIEPPQHRPSARAASARAALSTPSERRECT